MSDFTKEFDEIERKIIAGAVLYDRDPYPDPGSNLKKIIAKFTQLFVSYEEVFENLQAENYALYVEVRELRDEISKMKSSAENTK